MLQAAAKNTLQASRSWNSIRRPLKEKPYVSCCASIVFRPCTIYFAFIERGSLNRLARISTLLTQLQCCGELRRGCFGQAYLSIFVHACLFKHNLSMWQKSSFAQVELRSLWEITVATDWKEFCLAYAVRETSEDN